MRLAPIPLVSPPDAGAPPSGRSRRLAHRDHRPLLDLSTGRGLGMAELDGGPRPGRHSRELFQPPEPVAPARNLFRGGDRRDPARPIRFRADFPLGNGLTARFLLRPQKTGGAAPPAPSRA